MTRCENVVLDVPLVVPPPTFTPPAKVPNVQPMPAAPATAPKFTLPPDEEEEDVVVEVGT